MAAKKFYEIRNSAIHGRGVFAAKDIKAGARIMQYLGEKISKEESDRRGLAREAEAKKTGEGAVYIFELDDEFDIDGNFEYNDARLINHACRTNCEAVSEDGAIWIEALCDIAKGTELLYNYGYSFEHFMDHPCRCGFPECVGHIVAVEDRTRLKKVLRGRKSKSGSKSLFKKKI